MAKDEHRIIITHATELKPGAKYLVALDQAACSQEDAHLLTHALKGMGVENAVVLMTDGDPTNLVKVIEQEA